MSKTTSYTATDPETGRVHTRSTMRPAGYAFAVIITDLRENDHSWAEWASRRDLADKNAASWNAKRGTLTIAGRHTRYGSIADRSVDYGLGYKAIVVEAVAR